LLLKKELDKTFLQRLPKAFWLKIKALAVGNAFKKKHEHIPAVYLNTTLNGSLNCLLLKI